MAKRTNKKNDAEKLNAIKISVSEFEMHLKSLEDCILRNKSKSIGQMEKIIQLDLRKIAELDPVIADKCSRKLKNQKINEDNTFMDNDSGIDEEIERLGLNEEGYIGDEISQEDFLNAFNIDDDDSEDIYELANRIEETDTEDSFDDIVKKVEDEINDEESIYENNGEIAHDIIPLPSQGQCYKRKSDKLPVAYLTAADENLITSPNLYESGNMMSILLKKKVLDKRINIDELVSGDVDAIILFLRGTSYGTDFPIIATDPQTGKQINTTVDLNQLKYKPFNLVGDENGYFDFTMPKTKSVVKFRFLTKKDEKILDKLAEKESKGIASLGLYDAIEKIKSALKSDKTMSTNERNIIIDANNKISKWCDKLNKQKHNTQYLKSITNTMEMQIVSVNGDTDRHNIHNFVMNLPAGDSLAFRRYVYDNRPGVDFEITVDRPESMGGGSFQCFLEFDESILWRIA